jgi:HJR/Mrr/RecB family endonuclease
VRLWFKTSLPTHYFQDTRSERLEKLTESKKEVAGLESELNAYGDSNPAKVEEAKRAAFLAKEAAYRWTGM